jgi:hypothetical protein
MERDDKPGSISGAGIASEPLLPGQTPMRALRSGQGGRDLHQGRRRISRDGAFHPNGLTPDHFEPGTPDATAWPISPENRSERKLLRYFSLLRRGSRARSVQWSQYRTHPARFERAAALLTLCSQGTGTAMTNARSIQDPQGAITLRTPFLRIQWMVGRTAQRPIWLWSKSGAGKAVGKGGTSPLGRAIVNVRRGLF